MNIENVPVTEANNKLENLDNQQHFILIEALLLPWVIIWGWYLVLGLALFIFLARSNRFSIDFPSLSYQSAPLTVTNLYFTMLFFSLLSFILAYFSSRVYSKFNSLYFILNLFLLGLGTFLVLPMLRSLLI